MEELLKAAIRRLESIEKTLNLIYKDRDIMEETHVRVGTFSNETKILQDRVAKLEKRISADLAEVSDRVLETQESIENLNSVE